MNDLSDRRILKMRHAAAGAILLLAFVLRIWALDFGMPFAESRPDELTVIAKAMGYGTGDLNPHFFNYPSAFSYLLFLIYGAYVLLLLALGQLASLSDIADYFVTNPTAFFMMARMLSVAAGTLTVFIVYRIGLSFFGRATALCASAFLAVNYLHVRESHFGVTDTSMAAAVMLAVWCSLKLWKTGNTKWYILSGLSAGLAASFKYNGAIACLTIAVAHWTLAAKARKPLAIRLIDKRLITAAACAVAVFFLTSPYIILDWRTFLRDFLFEARHLAGEGEVRGARGWIHHAGLGIRYGCGWGLSLSAVVGACFLLRRRAYALCAICLVFPLVYYAAMGRGYTVFARYILPVVPFLCLLSGEAVHGLLLATGKRRMVGMLISGLVVCVAFVPPAIRSLEFAKVLGRKDTRAQMVTYLREHTENGAEIGWIGTRYGRPMTPDIQYASDERSAGPGAGRLVQARKTARARSGHAVIMKTVDPMKLAGAPNIIITEYYPLPYSLQSLGSAEELLQLAGYSKIQSFSGAEREVLADPGIKYDFQDSFYVPFSHPGAVERPGPTLTVWSRDG